SSRLREAISRRRSWHETCFREAHQTAARGKGGTHRLPWPGARDPSQGGGCSFVRTSFSSGRLVDNPTNDLPHASSSRSRVAESVAALPIQSDFAQRLAQFPKIPQVDYALPGSGSERVAVGAKDEHPQQERIRVPQRSEFRKRTRVE